MTIQILPPQLANQIAAGEVVERPASVVKELVENSIDAGSTTIDIDIRQGGHKQILIRDNGKGIAKDQLSLALSRHATSKISTLDDLERITSMGFRGEALASISSVARLTLTSKPEAQPEAWQAKAEGRDMAVTITPAAHPNGTTIDVSDLFFNTPARRKFLRSEKTEFMHIEEVIRRIALSRFDINFSLKHNGKLIKKYHAAGTTEQRLQRISKACHKGFSNDAVSLEMQYDNFTISGYILPFSDGQNARDFQYVYVNGRVMRDRVINHAIRQAFEMVNVSHANVAYILYITLPPEQVDINVHPAKHEVRFHQGRLIHDFIQRAIRDTLTELESGLTTGDIVQTLQEPEPVHDYIVPLVSSVDGAADKELENWNTSASKIPQYQTSFGSKSVSPRAANNYQQLVKSDMSTSVFPYLYANPQKLLVQDGVQFFVLPIVQLLIRKLTFAMQQPTVMQPLLMPVAVSLAPEEETLSEGFIKTFESCGLQIVRVQSRLILRQISASMRDLNWSLLFSELVNLWREGVDEPTLLLFKLIAEHNNEFSVVEAEKLWADFASQSPDAIRAYLQQNAVVAPLAHWLEQL